MRNIKLIIEYEGTNYAGWQEQRVKDLHAETETETETGTVKGSEAGAGKNPIPTIQACVREAVIKVVGEEVVLYGASRTDAGVHALGQTANFKTSSDLPAENFVPAINFYLPPDIVARSAEEAPEDFHAQYLATSKVYSYTVLNDRVPCAINRNFSYRYPWPLDVDTMKEAAKYLTGRHDFRAFSVETSDKKDGVRTVKSFEVTREGRNVRLMVEADGFLYKMVRGMVGTLLLVGRGKLNTEEFGHILESRDRRLAGPTAPARGLILVKVNYDNDNYNEKEIERGG
ncbi:MAG: tRNA pseudouridine(38-40) synthase TruA [Planctomycetota bacterium]|jgi:tRNA pseudouridine38-40 synthase